MRERKKILLNKLQRKIKKLVKKEVGSVAKRRVKKEEATLYALFVRETCRVY